MENNDAEKDLFRIQRMLEQVTGIQKTLDSWLRRPEAGLIFLKYWRNRKRRSPSAA